MTKEWTTEEISIGKDMFNYNGQEARLELQLPVKKDLYTSSVTDDENDEKDEDDIFA